MTRRAMLFGKLPACGDFVARGLSPERQAAWDGWATQELAGAREALAARFEGAHDVAPPLAFRIAGEGLAGLVAPSIDSVGRRFVLIAGLSGADEADLDPIAEAMDTAIRDDLDPDGLIRLLEGEPGPVEPREFGPVSEGLPAGLLLNHLTAVAAEIAP